jgi:hypothetical protein
MLYDSNFRLNENASKLKELDFGIVELIRRNEIGSLDTGHRLVPIILRTLEGAEKFVGGTMMSLPMGDCFYCFTDPDNPNYVSGGFVFENDALYFAEKMINLDHDRDAFRSQPTITNGNYATDLSFRQVIEQFQHTGISLFKTIETPIYYDKRYWPNEAIPNLGAISYEEAFCALKI